MLIIRDGWGINPGGADRRKENGDATLLASTPFHDNLYRDYPGARLSASGGDVGLPEGPPFFRFSNAGECRTELGRAGFVGVNVRTLALSWTLSSPDEVYEAISRGGVRTAAILRLQTPDALAAIRAAVRDAAEQYRTGDRIVLPMPAILARGVKA